MKLALGTAQFGMDYGVANKKGHVSLSDVKSILSLARKYGISTIDTAAAYGSSENALGLAGVNDFNIVSKLPPRDSKCLDTIGWIEKSVKNSLENLKVDSLYGFLLHRPHELLSSEGEKIFETLSVLKSKGIIKKIGVSIYEPEQLDQLYQYYSFDLVQTPMNLIDHRIIETGWLQRLKESGAEVHIRSAFLQGLLLMKSIDRPAYFNTWNRIFAHFDEWLISENISPLEACLGFLNSHPEIDKVIVGIDSVKQLSEIMDAVSVKIPEIPDSLKSGDLALINPGCWKL
ncbi:aldo/keto reductase [Nitrincola iocasae]|uniref:Aldo/keto reductase n=1 Tax=Nitrincola iocasae TaxID=2614693 RepID=A0A5J6LCH3_9GAMM|nr:aldo/keto reductase [Nitrincola iocasae]QEW05921.1 aldo/keto reductase [Nitrincola iocasae]